MVLSFLIPVLENEWKLDENQQSLLGSSTFIGFFFGCLISGQLADRWGRRYPLIFGIFINFCFGLGSSFSDNFATLVSLRFIFGISVGIISPISATYIIEICPTAVRGKMLIFTSIFWTMGELITCLLAYIFLDSFSSGNWRGLLLWASLPSFFTFLLILFCLEESPRFLLVSKKYSFGNLISVKNSI